MRVLVRFFWENESGQDLAEWGLLVALIGICCVVLLNQAGGAASGIWSTANVTLQTLSAASSPTGDHSRVSVNH